MVLLAGIAVAALATVYVIRTSSGLLQNIRIADLTFYAGSMAAMAGAAWLIGMAVWRLFRQGL